jgi:hypothetical protein
MILAEQVLDALARSYSTEAGYVFIRETTLGTSGRRADAVALQIYQSRGIALHGFEVKTHRRDWLRELKQAAKADELFRRCSYWSIVAPAGVAAEHEVPEAWGLFQIEADKSRFTTVRRPSKLEPDPLDLYTVALILRRAMSALKAPYDLAHLEEKRAEYERGLRDGRTGADPEKYQREDHQRLTRAVLEFEGATGVNIRDASWKEHGGRRLGQTVRFLLTHPQQVEAARTHLRSVARQLDRAAEDVSLPPDLNLAWLLPAEEATA